MTDLRSLDYLRLLHAKKQFNTYHERVMRDVDPEHPSVRRHNHCVPWTIAAALDAPDTVEQVMEAQADLQTALGFLRLELTEPLDDRQRGHLESVEDRCASSLARLHVLLETLGTTMMSPAQHPDVTGHPKDKEA